MRLQAHLMDSCPLHLPPGLCRFSAEAMAESQRRWRDGSLEEDLPMRSLSEMFNVNYFLVSQARARLLPPQKRVL